MKQTPLTNMENRWVLSTKEAFDALVGMGYTSYSNGEYSTKTKILLIDEKRIHRYSSEIHFKSDNRVKQAYYHNDHFYDQPYEEFIITDEKVPFPELEDIEWAMVEAPEWMLDTSFRFGGGFVFAGVHHIYMNNTRDDDNDDDDKMFVRLNKSEYSVIKALHENSKDFKVSFKLKEKINRKLHENRPLALAIGRGLLEGIIISDIIFFNLGAVKINNVGKLVFHNGDYWDDYFTLPDDYIIPEQVLQWMKEYQEQGIK